MEKQRKDKKQSRPTCCVYTLAVIVILVLVSIATFFALGLSFCDVEQKVAISRSLFGRTEYGYDVYIYSLKNDAMEVKITNYGGIITNVLVPDRVGQIKDVILGFDSLLDYETRNTPYFGAILGRYANRIAKGMFTLDGVKYFLAVNDPPNALHGGIKGFDKRVWQATQTGNDLILSYTSIDGEEQYPGEVKVNVTYTLTERNELIIGYNAVTSKPTIINLTNHGYFNLGGHASGNISDHYVQIDAEYYTPVDNTSIPTGVIANVNGTLFDLRTDTLIGPRLPHVPGGEAYDINYALGKSGWNKHVARVRHPPSGRTLDVYSTQPGVQFYTAYHLANVIGKGGVVYQRYGALCLETQHYPDSPNEPTFPSTVLRPGEVFQHTTSYVFGVEA